VNSLGSGFYNYEKRKPVENPNLEKFIIQARKDAKSEKKLNLSDDEIIEILFYPCVNEACRIIEEGHVYRASDIDIASCLGMGFPKHLGGLVKYGDLVGSRKVYQKLKSLYESTGEIMFKPCNYLQVRGSKNESLF
jgi:enoyl-CoA hydratase/3-hydroxyacyl-CoA dehydrogenase